MEHTITELNNLAKNTAVGDNIGFYKRLLDDDVDSFILGTVVAKYEYMFKLDIGGGKQKVFTWKDYLLGYIF